MNPPPLDPATEPVGDAAALAAALRASEQQLQMLAAGLALAEQGHSSSLSR
jgi:hypothetical protein